MELNNKKIIQTIFRSYFSRIKNIKLPLKDIKAAEAIMYCRTIEQGYNYLSCPDGHEDKIQTHSCKHRSCPICADKARLDWIESQKKRLLNCSHFHTIFTLPHEYLNLWQYNRKWFTKIFFKACRDTLIELLKDKKYLGATPGILMTLHTWGRKLNYHPHIHCLITAGGITDSNQWKELEGDFLLPIRVVKSLFRGKLQSYIKDALLNKEARLPEGITLPEMLRCHRELYKKQWSIRIQEKYEHGKGVVLYLARYMKGGPINPKQIISCGNKIKFHYKDHRDQRIKTLALKTDEFIRRLLWHVPEIGVHVVRHFGLYASKNQAKRNICREVVGGLEESINKAGKEVKDTLDWCCKVCGEPLRRVFSTFQSARYENSFIKRAYSAHVQQVVDAVITDLIPIKRPCRAPP
jgi:hypothetical protein